MKELLEQEKITEMEILDEIYRQLMQRELSVDLAEI